MPFRSREAASRAFKKNVPAVKYSTAMHYKQLATRLRQLIGLDTRIPPSGSFPAMRKTSPPYPPADRKAAAAAKAKLSRLLANHPKVTLLTRAVESKLGIMRMVTIRRIQPPEHGSGCGGKLKETPINPLISRVVRRG